MPCAVPDCMVELGRKTGLQAFVVSRALHALQDAFAPRSISACCACLRCRAPHRRGRCASSTRQLPLRRPHRRASRSSTRRAPRCAGSRCSSSPPAKPHSREAPGASSMRGSARRLDRSPSLRRTDARRGGVRPRRLCALGVSIEVTASGRQRTLLLNGVRVVRGLATPPLQRAPAAEPSLRRFASMAAALPALPPTPPATPVGRTLRRTRSGDLLLHATHRAEAPPQRRLRSAGIAMRAVSPLFSFRCPITHVRAVSRQHAGSTTQPQPLTRPPRASTGADGRPRGGCRRPLVRCAARQRHTTAPYDSAYVTLRPSPPVRRLMCQMAQSDRRLRAGCCAASGRRAPMWPWRTRGCSRTTRCAQQSPNGVPPPLRRATPPRPRREHHARGDATCDQWP